MSQRYENHDDQWYIDLAKLEEDHFISAGPPPGYLIQQEKGRLRPTLIPATRMHKGGADWSRAWDSLKDWWGTLLRKVGFK